jgi:hypothetical protein
VRMWLTPKPDERFEIKCQAICAAILILAMTR